MSEQQQKFPAGGMDIQIKRRGGGGGGGASKKEWTYDMIL